MPRILVVEDESDLRELLRYNLGREGYEVVEAGTGSAALSELRRRPADLVLLDLMLPDRDGLEVCKVIRADRTLAGIPVIMVTAKSDETDVVLGLGLGADDYVTKPFRVKELLARIRLRLRGRGAAGPDEKRVEAGGLVLDPVRHRVTVDGTVVTLTLSEFKLLQTLAAHPGVVFSRYQLLERIGDGEAVVTDRTVDVHIRNLRAKIKPYDAWVETERGVGYRFREEGLG